MHIRKELAIQDTASKSLNRTLSPKKNDVSDNLKDISTNLKQNLQPIVEKEKHQVTSTEMSDHSSFIGNNKKKLKVKHNSDSDDDADIAISRSSGDIKQDLSIIRKALQ